MIRLFSEINHWINRKRIPTEFFIILSAFSVGSFVAILPVFRISSERIILYVLNTRNSIFASKTSELSAIRSLLTQLDNEFVILILSFLAIFTTIPKTVMSVLASANGFRVATSLLILFTHRHDTPLYVLVLTVIFEIIFSCVILHNITKGLYFITNRRYVSQRFELSSIFSKSSFIHLYSIIHTYGSMILLSIIKSLLLSIIKIL